VTRPRPGWPVLLAVVFSWVLTGCVPATPDEDTWRYDARQAVSDVSSEVRTVALVLRHDAAGRFLGGYAAVTAANAEEAAGKAGDTLAAKQPPAAEEGRYATVTDLLDKATGLLAEARIAVAEGNRSAYQGLLDQLDAVAGQLDRLERELNHPPAESAAR